MPNQNKCECIPEVKACQSCMIKVADVAFNQNKQEEWIKLKDYLLAVHAEYEDRNGLDYCKNCGVDFKELTKNIESIIHQEREKAVREKVEEIRDEIRNVWGTNAVAEDIFMLKVLQPTNTPVDIELTETKQNNIKKHENNKI